MVRQNFSNGHIIADGTIAIDYWGPDPRPKLYFLTHLHAGGHYLKTWDLDILFYHCMYKTIN